jgi:hypothetical protein
MTAEPQKAAAMVRRSGRPGGANSGREQLQ